MKIDYAAEAQRLFAVEFGEWPEVVVRLLGVGLGGILLYLYTGWPSAWLWSGVYLGMQALHFAFLYNRRTQATKADCILAGLFFLAVFIAFIWMPALMARSDDLTLVFSGVTLSASTLAFMIRRSDTFLWMILGEVGILSGVLIIVLVSKLHMIEGDLALLSCVIVAVAMIAYMFQAIMSARKTRILGEAAARRAAQEQKMAAIGQLAGGVAHDFNNVLTAIIGNLELYEALHDKAEKDEVVHEAHAAAKRAEAVVSHLLIYARKAPVRRRSIQLNEAVQQTMQLAQRGIPPRIMWSLALNPTEMQVRVDEMQLTTALINLVRNAADAIDDAGKLGILTDMRVVSSPMTMADGSVLPTGRYACITVTDTGSGIPAEDLRRVLEPFFTTKPPGKGTGLGLSMVLGFARDTQGGLTISSSPKGTQVTVYLPCEALAPVVQAN